MRVTDEGAGDRVSLLAKRLTWLEPTVCGIWLVIGEFEHGASFGLLIVWGCMAAPAGTEEDA